MAVLHRIEALAGEGRYAVTFRRPDGAENTAVIHVVGSADEWDIDAAEASLPTGWTRGSGPHAALGAAVLAMHAARAVGPRPSALIDVDGGWDVMMGNVVLAADGTPSCTAHGTMTAPHGAVFGCSECGARAAFAG